MPNTKILKENGQEFYPVTHASLIVGMENQGRMDATYAWDGTGTPDITKIPAGVVVTYDGTSYTGTLAASADTAGRFYLVPSTTVTGEYDRYLTDATGSTITWKPAGTTAIPTPSILDNVISTDTDKALSANQGKLLKDDLSQLEAEVHNLSGKYYGLFESENDLPEGDTPGYAFVGAEAPFAIYNFDGEDWFDTGAVAQAIYGEPGVGLQTVTSLQDGTVVLTLTNGDTVTMDLNHNHPQYPKYVLCETLADYNAITTKDAATLYLIPGEAVYLGDVLIVRSGSPLPYTPVSYIETDGTAYIDTGIKGNAPKSSEMKLTPLSEGAFTTHLGARDGNNRFLLVCQWGNAGGYAYDNNIAFGYGAGANPGLSMADTLNNHTPIVVRTKMATGSQYFGIKQDGESSYTDTTATQAGTITTALNIYIFASNQDGSVAQHASNGVKVYYCKIFSDTNFTTPVFDGVPCVYNGEYGLWDKVSDTFFGNAAGSGAFTGPQI